MRPTSHQTGDIGVNAVEGLILKAGWVVNRIHSDYGEDLSVQPSTRGNVEKCRIYVQVKTVGSARRKSVSIRRDDAFIWQFSHDIFLLVSWMMLEKQARYVCVNETNDPTLFSNKESHLVSFSLKKMKPLDKAALASLQAEARNKFYDGILERISDFLDEREGYTKNKSAPDVLEAKIAMIKVANRFLIEDGIFTKEGRLSYRFMKRHLLDIVQFGLERKKSQSMRRLDSGDWAILIIEYIWTKKFGRLPGPSILWALHAVVRTVVTDSPSFKWLTKEMVLHIKRQSA